jgi:Domain of unknown function (DUF6457)
MRNGEHGYDEHEQRGGPVTTIERWIQAACAELGLAPDAVPVRTVLDLARDVAHQVERPAAPVTAFILGLAAGRGQNLDEAAASLTDLAATWPAPDSPAPDSPAPDSPALDSPAPGGAAPDGPAPDGPANDSPAPGGGPGSAPGSPPRS